MITATSHAPFLHAMQEWVWKRFPTRQLSATDIFYVLQWAASEIPVSEFIRAFDRFLDDHPHVMDDGCRLSKLQFEAKHLIASCRQHGAAIPQPVPELTISNPFLTALDRVVLCGRRTKNDLLREKLRELYQTLRQSLQTASTEMPDWASQTADFYRFKARAILDWEKGVQDLCRFCFEKLLTDGEQRSLSELTGPEKAHLMYLGPEARSRWLSRRIDEKTAIYLGMPELLEEL